MISEGLLGFSDDPLCFWIVYLLVIEKQSTHTDKCVDAQISTQRPVLTSICGYVKGVWNEMIRLVLFPASMYVGDGSGALCKHQWKEGKEGKERKKKKHVTQAVEKKWSKSSLYKRHTWSRKENLQLLHPRVWAWVFYFLPFVNSLWFPHVCYVLLVYIPASSTSLLLQFFRTAVLCKFTRKQENRR